MADVFGMTWRLLALFGIGYVALTIIAHFISTGMIFPRPPANYTPGTDHLRMKTPDGVTLTARHWPNPSARYTMLYLHGNGEDLGIISGYIEEYVKAGFAVFAFEYRGYGHSGGRPDEATTYQDAQLAYRYVRETLKVPADRIVVFGYSLGGGPAVELARREKIGGLILEGAFVSAYRVMTRFPLFPADKFVNLAKLPHVGCPVLVIHGTDDRTVPFWHGQSLFAAAREPKRSLWVEGGGHGGLAEVAGEKYWQTLHDFVQSLDRQAPETVPAGR